MQIRKEMVWGFYGVFSFLSFIAGYSFTKKHNLEYGLLFLLVAILISLVLWVTWGSKNTY